VERYDYTYDVRNLILTQTNLIGGVINAWSYGYDLSQRLTNAMQLTNGTLAHTYAYAYDPAGNRTNVVLDGVSVVETANIVNQLTNQTPATILTYDLAGNELARSNATSVLKLGWNGADQCTAITNGVLVTLIQYDGLGHWVRITDYNGASPVDDRRFIWSGNTLVEERDATGTNIVKRFYANGFQQNGTNFYYLKDNLGSIREVTDANGNIVARFSYDPYGNRTQTLGTLQVDYGFAGLFNIAGLDAAVYRFYDPTTARWINRDPIGETGGWNLYAYCGNDPANVLDPLGTDPVWGSDQIKQAYFN
jgi:RHS repeat-associated protein